MSLISRLKKAVKSVAKKVSSAVSKVASATEKAVSNVIKNPLPVIETVVLTSVGVPAPVASAAVTAANGGSVKDIAISAGASYVGTKAGEVGAYGAASTGTTSDTLVKAAASATGASTQAVLTGLAKGQGLNDALSSGLKSGVTAGLTTSAIEGVKSVVNPELTTAGTAPVIERGTSETGEPMQQVYGGQSFPISETAATGQATSEPLIGGTSSSLLSSALGKGIYSGLFGSTPSLSQPTTVTKTAPPTPVTPTQTQLTYGPGSQALAQALRVGDVGAPVFGGEKEGGKKAGWNVESLRYMGNSEA